MSRSVFVAIVALVLIVSVATGAMSRSQSTGTPETPGTPVRQPTATCSPGAITVLCIMQVPTRTPPPLLPPTCMPLERNTGCYQTPANALREHWTATAAAGG